MPPDAKRVPVVDVMGLCGFACLGAVKPGQLIAESPDGSFQNLVVFVATAPQRLLSSKNPLHPHRWKLQNHAAPSLEVGAVLGWQSV